MKVYLLYWPAADGAADGEYVKDVYASMDAIRREYPDVNWKEVIAGEWWNGQQGEFQWMVREVEVKI